MAGIYFCRSTRAVNLPKIHFFHKTGRTYTLTDAFSLHTTLPGPSLIYPELSNSACGFGIPNIPAHNLKRESNDPVPIAPPTQ